MPYDRPEETDSASWELDVTGRDRPSCGRMMHSLRDLAEPVLEADRHAEVRMRKEVRGLLAIGQAVPARSKAEPSDDRTPGGGSSHRRDDHGDGGPAFGRGRSRRLRGAGLSRAAGGILNDDRGGPLHPPGLRMAERRTRSTRRPTGPGRGRGASRRSSSAAWPDASRPAWTK